MTLVPAPERSFAHYDVERPLGRGAIGMVYLARDRRIGRRVALKTIQVEATRFEDSTAAADFYKRLQWEAEVCGALLHPNLVTLYETGYEDQRVSWLAMEYVDGETLQKTVERLGRIPPFAALQIMEGVLRGLEYAHAKAIIHRDIKPANVLIAADGTVKIADFGIARLPHSSLTGAGFLMGTPNYISPEQILGRTATTGADLFSCGAMLYEMLTGLKPFAGEHVTAVLHNVLRREVPHASDVNPAVPREIGDFAGRLLDKNVDARPSASEALAAIERLRRATPVEGVAVVTPATWNWRTAAAVAAAAAAVVVALWFISLSAIRRSAIPRPAFTTAQLDEFARKRRTLQEAHALLQSGKSDEAAQRYEAYLAKYPWSSVARDGRDRAAAEIAAKQPPKRHRRQDEHISPSELLRRIKRVFKP